MESPSQLTEGFWEHLSSPASVLFPPQTLPKPWPGGTLHMLCDTLTLRNLFQLLFISTLPCLAWNSARKGVRTPRGWQGGDARGLRGGEGNSSGVTHGWRSGTGSPRLITPKVGTCVLHTVQPTAGWNWRFASGCVYLPSVWFGFASVV